MRIALFASSFHPHIGGVEELVRQLCREYRQRGDEAIVVTNRWPPDLAAEAQYDGTLVYRFPMRGLHGPLKARVKFRVTQRAVMRNARDVLLDHDVELIHVQCVGINGYYARALAQDLQVPLVVTSQGERTMDADNVFDHSRFLNATLRDLLANADFVTACSRATLLDLEAYMGRAFGPRASVIYNGIAREDFDDASIPPYRHRSRYVLAVGRWVRQKGFDVLIRAFATALQEQGLGHDLLLAGAGPEEASLEALVEEICPPGRVHLVGRADRAQVVSLFKGCSFVVVPSRQEPFGIVNLEAMAAGKAVVASAVGGIPEIVRDEENGLLVPCDDPGALATAMARLASDHAFADRLGQSGRLRAEVFAWSKIADEYQAVYDRLLAS